MLRLSLLREKLAILRYRKKFANKHKHVVWKNSKWKLSWDIIGLTPKFNITCPFCKTEMVLRYSRLHVSPELKEENTHIDMAYKCPICDYFTVFGIPVPPQYWLHILELRRKLKIGLIYAPIETWTKSDQEIIKERLQALGYW